MGSQVSYPVRVESVRPGLYCARWRMADSVRDFRYYANSFRLPGSNGRRARTYSITATWVDRRYVMVVEAGPVIVNAFQESAKEDSDSNSDTDDDFEDLPYSVWISYGGGKNQMLNEAFAGSWRIDDFQFNTSIGQSPFFSRFPYHRPWAGCGLTFRLWLDFHPRRRSERNALKNLSDLFRNQEDCDVKFIVQGEVMSAHLTVLRARSPVMAAMFRHDMQESRTKEVVIEDFSPEVFRELLLFLYSGRARRLSEDSTQSLLLAADKYAVEDLREECLAMLRQRISLDNALDTLCWAHANSVQVLAESALAYITQHGQDKLRWDEVAKSCPDLLLFIDSNKQNLSNDESRTVISL